MFFCRSQSSVASNEDLKRFLLEVQECLINARQCFVGQYSNTELNQQLDNALQEVNQVMKRLSQPKS